MERGLHGMGEEHCRSSAGLGAGNQPQGWLALEGAGAAWREEESVQAVLSCSATVKEHPWVKRGWSWSLRGRSARKP